MYICTSWDFLVGGKGQDSLVGKMALALGDDAWCTVEMLEDGTVEILT